MKIRTLLMATLPLALAVVIGTWVVLLILHEQLDDLATQRYQSQNVVRSTSALLILTNEYALHSQERTEIQWRAHFQNIQQLLSEASTSGSSNAEEALAKTQQINELFTRIVESGATQSDEIQIRRKRLLFEQLLIHTQALFDAVDRWDETRIKRRIAAESQFHGLSISAPVLMLMVVIGLVTLIIQRVLKPLNKLQQAVIAVANGSLSVRTDNARKDELGLISKTFDAMAIDLVSQLREREAQLNQILDASSVGIALFDDSGHLTKSNQCLTTLFRCSEEELVGSEFLSLLPPDERDSEKDPMRRLSTGSTASFDKEIQFFRSDQSVFWGQLGVNRFVDHDGLARGYVVVIADITNRKLAEENLKFAQEQMLQMEKLSALGTLVGGVAHEINNPLMGLSAYIEYAETHAENSRTKEMLGRAQAEVERIGRLVKNMLVFARIKPTQNDDQTNLASVVSRTLSLLKADCSRFNIQCAVNIPDEICVRCNEDSMQQVLLNLLMNARDAVSALVGDRIIEISAREEGEVIVLSIQDNGTGVPADTVSRIFEPFFTTKPPGQGTGLGLAVSHQAIEAAGGTLALAKNGEQGACFEVRLNKV